MRFGYILHFFVLFTGSSYAQTVSGFLDFTSTRSISPLIYGYNQDHEDPAGEEHLTSRRLGGNRMSVFNWENGASNSGHDNSLSPNDNRIPSLVGVAWADKDKAGEVYRVFQQNNLSSNIESVITVPILGWVAADKDGSNLTSPPSVRWDEMIYVKGKPFSLIPDVNDGKVFLDESIYYLTQSFGNALSANGVKYIALDNEPAYWDNTHPLVQPSPVGCDEYIQKVIDAAKAVKSIDPNVKIIAGEFAGTNIYDFGSAPDWGAVGSGYDWFISYFLDKMKEASDDAGYPLIDIISIHNYAQHKIDVDGNFSSTGEVVRLTNTSADYIRQCRMDFARSFWDESYIEPSWITNAKLGGESTMHLKRLQKSIDTYFPGIKIMIGEFDVGNNNDVSHGIALADYLGVFAQYGVYMANHWDIQPYDEGIFTSLAFKLFRNYDGLGSGFGDVSVMTTFDSPDKASIWASLDSDDEDLHLILLNKNLYAQDFTVSLENSNLKYEINKIVGFGEGSSGLSEILNHNANVTGFKLNVSLTALSAWHIVLKKTEIVTGASFDQNSKMLQISPNPAKDKGVIKLKLPVKNAELNIVDSQGKVVFFNYGLSGDECIPLNNMGLSPGLFSVNIIYEDQLISSKLIKVN